MHCTHQLVSWASSTLIFWHTLAVVQSTRILMQFPALFSAHWHVGCFGICWDVHMHALGSWDMSIDCSFVILHMHLCITPCAIHRIMMHYSAMCLAHEHVGASGCTAICLHALGGWIILQLYAIMPIDTHQHCDAFPSTLFGPAAHECIEVC